MNEEQIQMVRMIIRDELQELLASDRYIFHKTIQILDGRNIQLGRSNGTQIGTATDQKVGFYGTAPIAQRSGVAQAAIAITGAVADGDGVYGYTTAAQADAIVTLANELRAYLVASGQIKGSS